MIKAGVEVEIDLSKVRRGDRAAHREKGSDSPGSQPFRSRSTTCGPGRMKQKEAVLDITRFHVNVLLVDHSWKPVVRLRLESRVNNKIKRYVDAVAKHLLRKGQVVEWAGATLSIQLDEDIESNYPVHQLLALTWQDINVDHDCDVQLQLAVPIESTAAVGVSAPLGKAAAAEVAGKRPSSAQSLNVAPSPLIQGSPLTLGDEAVGSGSASRLRRKGQSSFEADDMVAVDFQEEELRECDDWNKPSLGTSLSPSLAVAAVKPAVSGRFKVGKKRTLSGVSNLADDEYESVEKSGVDCNTVSRRKREELGRAETKFQWMRQLPNIKRQVTLRQRSLHLKQQQGRHGYRSTGSTGGEPNRFLKDRFASQPVVSRKGGKTRLRVLVHSARDCVIRDRYVGSSDPLVAVDVLDKTGRSILSAREREKYRTQVIRESLSPVWEEMMDITRVMEDAKRMRNAVRIPHSSEQVFTISYAHTFMPNTCIPAKNRVPGVFVVSCLPASLYARTHGYIHRESGGERQRNPRCISSIVPTFLPSVFLHFFTPCARASVCLPA